MAVLCVNLALVTTDCQQIKLKQMKLLFLGLELKKAATGIELKND